MVLAIGLVVDDAIVMLENICRHVEDGQPPFQAALKGAREIAFADRRHDDHAGGRLRPDRLPDRPHRAPLRRVRAQLAGAVLVSGFVALSLSPMMCSLLLRHPSGTGCSTGTIERGLDGSTNGYRRRCCATLRIASARAVVLAAILVVGGAASCCSRP